MKFNISDVFKRKNKNTEYNETAEDKAYKAAIKKRTSTAKKKKMLPFFRRLQVWSSLLFVFVFLISLLGFISFTTIDASLSKSIDTNLPQNVKEIKDEYTKIKKNYSKFDFLAFKKLFGQTEENKEEAGGWGNIAGAFFGTDQIKYIKAAVEKAGNAEISPEEAGIQTPQVSVMGISMKNDKEMVIAINFNGRQETWTLEKIGGKWTSKSLPPEYILLDMKLDGQGEIPYMEIALRNSPAIKWKIQLANTAVKDAGVIGNKNDKVTSETNKMRTAGSYIMIKENGKVKYINMATPVPEGQNPNTGQPGQNTGKPVQPGQTPNQSGQIPNQQGQGVPSAEEIQRMIESIPVKMPVKSKNGSTGTLNTTMDIEKNAPPTGLAPQGVSNIQMIKDPASDVVPVNE